MFFARKNRKLLRNSYGFLSGKTLSRGQPSRDFRYVRDKTTRYLLCQVARPGCRDPQEVYESELVDKATNYCNRCFQRIFFWTLLILDSFYDYSVGQLDVVWGDLVQKPCQICRKSESSAMSACEWSSESEPHRFLHRRNQTLLTPNEPQIPRPRRKIPLPRRMGFEAFLRRKKFTKWQVKVALFGFLGVMG